MKARVVFLASAANIHTKRWALHLAKKYSIIILSFESAQIDGVEVIPLRSPVSGLLRYLWAVPFVRRALADLRPQILHAHYAGGYGLLGALSGFHPYVLSVWGSDIYVAPRESLINRQLVKWMLKKADYLCATSNAMAKEARRYVSRGFLVTPFGVDCDTYRPLEPLGGSPVGEVAIVGTVKKLDKLYGVDKLLRAFALLCNGKPNVPLRLLIVGDGDEQRNLRELADVLGISSRVDFVGSAPQEEVPVLLNKMMVFVALSRSESFGVAVLEASACGLPVVVSDAGGLPEVVVDGETGFVIANGDPASAAKAIKRLIDEPALRERMGAAGRQFVNSKYRWTNTVKKMEALYARISPIAP